MLQLWSLAAKLWGACCPVRAQTTKMGSLVAGQEFQHILRLLNTNVDGRNKIMYALTAIRGIGRRFSNIVCKKAEVDLKKRAGTQQTAPSSAVSAQAFSRLSAAAIASLSAPCHESAVIPLGPSCQQQTTSRFATPAPAMRAV